MPIDKYATVRKLLTKAQRAGTAEEAAAYTAKAVALMARHGIDAALDTADPAGDDGLGATRIPVTGPYSAGKARLLGWVADALRCRCVLHQARGGRVVAVTMFGHASDRERVELLYASLLLQATGRLLVGRPSAPGESLAAYRRSWLHGFAAQVHRRLVEAEQAAGRAAEHDPERAGDTSVALVLADRSARVERAFAAAFPQLGRARPRTLSGSGGADGARAGARADLGRGHLGGPLRPLNPAAAGAGSP